MLRDRPFFFPAPGRARERREALDRLAEHGHVAVRRRARGAERLVRAHGPLQRVHAPRAPPVEHLERALLLEVVALADAPPHRRAEARGRHAVAGRGHLGHGHGPGRARFRDVQKDRGLVLRRRRRPGLVVEAAGALERLVLCARDAERDGDHEPSREPSVGRHYDSRRSCGIFERSISSGDRVLACSTTQDVDATPARPPLVGR
jgi:hypothetical protein